ncbi:polysaccharide biosynthesis C-terminal domain-containing protein [candidate division KSB1 bacterium]
MSVRICSNILLVVVLAKNLSPADFGVFSLIRTTVIIGIYLVGFELYNYTNRFIPGKSFVDAAGLLGNLLLFEIIFIVLTYLLIFGSGLDHSLARAINIEDNHDLLRLGFVILLLTLFSREFQRYFIITKRIQIANMVNFFMSNFWIFAASVLWAVNKTIRLEQIILLWLITTALSWIYIAFRFNEWKYLAKKLSFKKIKNAMSFSAPLYATSISQQTSNRSNFYFLAYFHNTRVAGIYSFSYNIVTMGIGLLGTIFSDLLVPYITEHHNKGRFREKIKLLTHQIHYAIMIVFPALIAFIVEGEGIIPIIGKTEYLEANRIIPLLIIIMIVNQLANAGKYLLFLENKIWLIAMINLIGVLVNITLNLALIPRFSYYGAAIASVCSFSLVLLLFYWQIRRFKLIDISRIRWARLGSVFAGFALFGYGLRYVLAGWVVPSEPYLLIVWSILFMTLYIFGVWRYFLEDADRAEVRKLAEVIKRKTLC